MRVCEGFVEAGCSVDLWAPGSRTCFDSIEELSSFYGIDMAPRIAIVPRHARRAWAICCWAAAAIRASNAADFTYCRDARAALALRTLGMATVLEVHSPAIMETKPWKALMKWPLRRHLTIVAISRALEERLDDETRTRCVKVVCEPDAVQQSKLAPSACTSPDRGKSPQRRLNAAYAGTIAPGRGIELIHQLALKSPEINFHFAGRVHESLRDWFKRKLMTQENVTYAGELRPSAISDWLYHADCLLAPYVPGSQTMQNEDSTAWMSPLKVFEYMASSRPILISDLPTIREVLDERSAVLLPPQEVEPWHAALRRLLGDRDYYASQARESLRLVERHTWKSRGARILLTQIPPAERCIGDPG